MSDETCPNCGHSWRAHQGRAGGQRCYHRDMAHDCTCREMNPAVAAEDRLAAGLWNAYLGRA